uniref:Uncharacterized protein n=1 Tax=Acrobeloides nanus TaxID=290746 RepID=A0A914DIZ1_9BILA
MGFNVRWRPRIWCHLFYFFILFTLTQQQDLTPVRAKAFAAPQSENAIEVDGEKKAFFKIGPIRKGVQKGILDEVQPSFGREGGGFEETNDAQDFEAYDDNVLTDLNRESPIFVPSLYRNETRDANQATKTPPTTTPRPKTRRPPPPRITRPPPPPPETSSPPPPPEISSPPPPPAISRPPQPPQPFRNIPQQTNRPPPPPQPAQPTQQQQLQQVQQPSQPQPQQFPPQQPQFQQRPQPQQPTFQPQQPFQQQQQQFRPQSPPPPPPQQFLPPFQPQQQQQQNFQQFQTPVPQFQQTFQQPFVPQQQPQFPAQPQQFQTAPQFQTLPETTTRAPSLPSQLPSTRGPFRPLRPFRPQPPFNRPRPNDPTGLRNGVCPETIFYETVPANVFELQQFYSHFAVVVSVDQCARTCHEFNCAAAFFDPRDGHCQFNPATAAQVPQGACPNWPNPLYRNNVRRGGVPLKLFCVTCQRRRLPKGRGRGRRPRIQRPRNLRFEPTVIGRSAVNAAVHGVVLKQPQAIAIGFGPSTSREDWYIGSKSNEKSKESLESFGQDSTDLRSSSERFKKLSQKSSHASATSRDLSTSPFRFSASAFSSNFDPFGQVSANSSPTSRVTKSQESRISRGQQMMEPSDVHEEEHDDSNTEVRIPALSSRDFRARFVQRGVPTRRQRLPHSEVLAGSLSDLSESS